MVKKLGLVLLTVAGALSLTGCLDVHQTVRLERDLTGQADFTLGIDLEPMVHFLAVFARQMAGKQGDPTAAELEKQRSEMIASAQAKKGDDEASFARRKPEIEKSLPPGVHLLGGDVDDQGLKIRAHVAFSFDDAAKLAAIRIPQDGNDPRSAANPYDQPFSGLRLIDEGTTVLVAMESTNPRQKFEQQLVKEAAPQGDAEQLVASAFKDARYTFQLDTPLTVVTTNATRREGTTLFWEYSLASLPKDGLPKTLMARLRK